jgi:hypothetical protein
MIELWFLRELHRLYVVQDLKQFVEATNVILHGGKIKFILTSLFFASK